MFPDRSQLPRIVKSPEFVREAEISPFFFLRFSRMDLILYPIHEVLSVIHAHLSEEAETPTPAT
jgi:hypothetical protein